MSYFVYIFLKCVSDVPLTCHIFIMKFYLRGHNIYEDSFLLFTNILFKMPEFNPLSSKKNHVRKYHLILLFCSFINDFISFPRFSMKGAALPKEPHRRSGKEMILKQERNYWKCLKRWNMSTILATSKKEPISK